MTEKIECAAIKFLGHVARLPRPNRHHDIINTLDTLFPNLRPFTGEQGFLTTEGRFFGRIGAAQIAVEAGQVERSAMQNPRVGLFSEDLW